MGPLTADIMIKALTRLDELMESQLSTGNQGEIQMIMGGGGAMILAHQFPLGTTDIDAVAKGIELSELDVLVKKIAEEQNISKDWLNPYFSTFAHTLPSDYGDRLVEVFRGEKMRVFALGKEEMLLMKCFAHRQKDVGHAKSLIKQGVNIKRVEAQIEALQKKGIRGGTQALEFLEDVLDQLEQ